MKIVDWEIEVQRVADALGLNLFQAKELCRWSIHMAHNDLKQAQKLFVPECRIAFPGTNPGIHSHCGGHKELTQ